MQRIIERPFAFLFPIPMPEKVERKLIEAMEKGGLSQGDVAPQVYDIYLSYGDHQEMQTIEAALVQRWGDHLAQYAREHNYFLNTHPIIRLHPDGYLRKGQVRIEATMVEKADGNNMMHTQSLSKEQLEQLQRQLGGQALPGITGAGGMTNPGQGQYGPPGAGPSGVQPPFTPAYAAAMPPAMLTIRLAQSGNQKDYRIEKPIINIGRQLTNDIIVEDKRVSRYHAQIKYQDRQFTIYDLGSTNGITINGTPNQRVHVLQNGDRFTIGSYDFYFQRR